MQGYKLHKQGYKYYIIPNVDIASLHNSEKYFSFYFKRKAEKILKIMNTAFNDGFSYKVFKNE